MTYNRPEKDTGFPMMKFNSSKFLRSVLPVALIAVMPLAAQTGTENGEWRYYGGDDYSTRYSPLDQIDASNVDQLKIAWRFKTTNFGPSPQASSETTPLMVGGKLYFTAGVTRTVVAADAKTGESLWTFRLAEEGRGAVRTNNRGLAYWTDGDEERIIVVSPGYQMFALDASDGHLIEGFGSDGLVDLWIGLRDLPAPGKIGLTSPAIVVGDTIVVGMASGVGVALPTIRNVPGYIRGYDVHTGELVWTFHTVPLAGEFGEETWGNESNLIAGHTGAWGPLTADTELGLVYVPTEMPSGDLYGGHRPGDNLFGDSVLALNAATGERVWHFQLIHHDLWDWDIPAAPVLLNVTVNGVEIPAVAQVTKQAFTYVFNRETGDPVWPIEERPVPQSNVQLEQTSRTQPFPTLPAAFDYQGYSPDILVDFTPEIKQKALDYVQRYNLGPIFTPPIVKGANGKEGTFQLPGAGGGANWTGASADPETGMLYVPSVTGPYISSLVHDPDRSQMEYIAGGALGGPNVEGLPIVKPPYGRITAIDLNTGEHAWMIPNGTVSQRIADNPIVREAGIDPNTLGGGDRSPLLVTKTLLFGGGSKLRVINKTTGEVIHEMELPGPVTGGPMTYAIDGKQYIVATVGGQEGAEFIALTLPE